MSYISSRLNDAFCINLAPTSDEIMAYVFAHMGVNQDASDTVNELLSFDKLSVGRYMAMRYGFELGLCEDDRKTAMYEGALFTQLYQTVGQLHYYLEF